MSSESLLEFEKSTEILPFTKYGISSLEQFKNIQDNLQHKEWLKKAGLSPAEMILFEKSESGLIGECKKVDHQILEKKLEIIYKKVANYKVTGSLQNQDEEPSTSNADIFKNLVKRSIKFYPEGHPMNHLKQIEEDLFGHLKNNDILPIMKRRKMLRRLERKKQRIESQKHQLVIGGDNTLTVTRPGSLWDVKDMTSRKKKEKQNTIIGPKKQTMYTIQDKKIVRLEPTNEEDSKDEYKAVNIVVPINSAEKQLLEGTKMSLEDIKNIDRFKDYTPGTPSRVLYLKNIAPVVTQEQLSLLFNQFVLENYGPIDLRLMSGRMRGQAFVAFHNEELAIRALEEVHGTILCGRPIIAQFGRNSNRVQDEET